MFMLNEKFTYFRVTKNWNIKQLFSGTSTEGASLSFDFEKDINIKIKFSLKIFFL